MNVHEALRQRFAAPEWALLFEVRNSTGHVRTARTADAIAMSTYPSRGLELIGIEIKTARGDWLREMRDPDKAVEIQQYCDRWYLAVSDDKIIGPGELPLTWGLLSPRGDKLICKKEAQKNVNPTPLNRKFLAAIMRNAHGASADTKQIAAAVATERRRIEERNRELKTEIHARAQYDHNELMNVVRKFEEASGVSIRHHWDTASIGTAVKFVKNGGLTEQKKEIEFLAAKLEEQVRRLRETAQTI